MLSIMMCHKTCKPATGQCWENQCQYRITPLLYLLTWCPSQPNQILLRINAKTNFCFAVTHTVSNYDWCWMIYQNMLVVQQADFEKIKFEYDVTILIIAGNCIGHCHYLYDLLCILALHGFASKITTICFNSESVTANKNLLNVCYCWEVR